MTASLSLVNELFRAFHIQRWNDRIRPMELTEMDKHGHKMVVAYCLGKYEEDKGKKIDWDEIIRGGIFELLRRIIISDIKSPIFREIKKNKDVYKKLNHYVYEELEPKIEDEKLKKELAAYILSESASDTLSNRILEAAHIYASFWEFQIIQVANPYSYQNTRIAAELLNDINDYADLEGIKKLTARHTITNFVDLCGQLRFQIRWAQMPRVPRTSVLGHSLLVACVSYLFARENNAGQRRLYNNFFGGLFHDLPEAVTRDILSPVKQSSKEFEKLLKTLEKKLAAKEIYPLVEEHWLNELKYFTQDEFDNKIHLDGKIIKHGITIDNLNDKYNPDIFEPYDGESVRAADHLSAFLEAWHSCNSGIKTDELIQAAGKIRENYINRVLGKVHLNEFYKGFDGL